MNVILFLLSIQDVTKNGTDQTFREMHQGLKSKEMHIQ